MKIFGIIFLTIVVWSNQNCFSQKGNYFIHNYLPSQYVAADQNRCIIQDKYGRILVANNDGVLINNGSEWQILRLPFLCLSLAKNDNDEIFVAGDGNFGKLVQKTNGEFKYDSLIQLLPKNEKEINKIWSIITLKDHVYFCSNQKIFDYHQNKIVTISPGEEGFHTFFKVGDHLLVKERGKGLSFLSYHNEMALIRGGKIFADNTTPIRGIIKSKEMHYIISPKGVFEFDFNNSLPEVSVIKKISTPLDNWLMEKTVYFASSIGSDHFAFGSVSGGLVITDTKFNPVKYINADNELQDDGVNYIYNDYQGHLWLALAKGISLIEFNNPITKFTKGDGVKGTVEGCLYFNNTIYLATDKGLLKYNNSTNKFEPTNITEVTWCLKIINGELIVGTKSGLYILEKNGFTQVYQSPTASHCLLVDESKKESLVYLGTESGYAKLLFENKTFKTLKEFYDLNADIRTIVSDNSNTIYFGTTSKGILIAEPNSDSAIVLSEKNGLNIFDECNLLKFEQEILVFNAGQILTLSKENGKYKVVRNNAFKDLTEKYAFLLSHAVIKGRIWLNYKPKGQLSVGEGLMCVENKNGKFEISPTQLSRIKESDTRSFCSNDSIVYIGTNNGLYCYDTRLKKTNTSLYTFVNLVKFGRDSTHCFYNLNPNTKIENVELAYKNNLIEIYLGASDFIDKNELLFSYYMEGLESGYKDFTNKKSITYDYLHEGNYVLHVKSKNILGSEGEEIEIPFTILAPWYRTIWGYIAYGILFLFTVYIIIKLYAKRLIEQNLRLENIITERTKEIQHQKHEIEHKNQEITDSINYAKGIQDSILPEIEEIKKYWQDLFVFFQPKDIVSGDFYWFKNINENEFLIACCDCTGHGVPGGFMSMICSGKLHDAALISTEPDKILYLANNGIKENLRQQSEGKNKDGMEICLLKVNTLTREIKYSGANRPLWIYDSKTHNLSEIKPTKASIASSTSFNSSYELHEFKLNAGDILYVSSDGYADQFGGEFGKKYMSKNFKNFLLDKASLPMNVQLEEIKANIYSWMKNHEQVDDL